MARPIPDINLRDISKHEDIKPRECRSYFDLAVDSITSNRSSRNLVFGTFTGWFTGVTVIKVGKIAAFGLGGGVILLHFATRPSIPAATLTTSVPEPERPHLPPEPITPIPRPHLPPEPITPIPKLAEPFKPTEEPNMFLEKPPFLLQPKPLPHSPKISPSSIPNPSPSVTTTKQVEPGYPSYGGYLYSIPGYSAFQPVSYPGVVQPNQAPLVQNESPLNDFVPYPTIAAKETLVEEKTTADVIIVTETPRNPTPEELPKPQTDFEDHFTPEIIPPPSMSENSQASECKMSITSLTQGSGATVTIPSQVTNKETKPKPTERFSLKTSIPISKIDLKCVNPSPDTVYQNSVTKKIPASQPFQSQKPENAPRVEIQSNIVIKTAQPEPEIKEMKPCPPNNSISTLINAAEAINKSESQFRKPDPKSIEIQNEVKDNPPPFTPQPANPLSRPIFNPINVDNNKVNYSSKPTDGPFNEQKNQILFIQNKNTSNPKMLLTIQQQNPQVLLQRSNFESKNLQAPSRLLSQSKKCKEELVNDNGSSSKVVALKRLHQENCDENDFENLITENQIYGNKIVVKEKSQGTQQEQDLKNKAKIDKTIQNETKNVVLQPNFVYLSNVQFPANLMMIKNNPKISQGTDTNNIKQNKMSPNENKNSEVSPPVNNNIDNSNTQTKAAKPQNVAVSKEIHVLKSSNNVLQTLSNKNTKPDIVFQTTNQKVIMNPQIVYQVPMIVETDNKTNQPFINREFPKHAASNQNQQEFTKPFEPNKSNDKLYIACPYQMDSKLQPKIVITNIRPKVPKVDEVSSLDLYEKRRRLRRLKHLSNRETKDQKTDVKKVQEKAEIPNIIITPEKMTAEVYKEFTKTKVDSEDGNSESDIDYGEEELNEYNAIIKKYAEKKDEDSGKLEFLSGFRLASKEIYKEKQMERQERILRWDSVASAYIAAGQLDRLINEETQPEFVKPDPPPTKLGVEVRENGVDLQRKQTFLSHLKLVQVSSHYKQGYEKVWHEVLKERKRRDRTTENGDPFKKPRPIGLDPNGQLQILTEIKKCVNDNNNLIKKRLDCSSAKESGDSIKVLAEKNFSELNRLSKMADRSVKIFSGQETRKRDLNPGFDSENIQKSQIKIESKNFTNLTIPSISRIISLKTTHEKSAVTTSLATTMDEPKSSAAGVKEMFKDNAEGGKAQDFGCQVGDVMPWPGIEEMIKSYKEYEIARKKEIAELHRSNTALRVESAYVTRNASHDSDQARALLAERQHLAGEEAGLRRSVRTLCAAIEAIRNSSPD